MAAITTLAGITHYKSHPEEDSQAQAFSVAETYDREGVIHALSEMGAQRINWSLLCSEYLVIVGSQYYTGTQNQVDTLFTELVEKPEKDSASVARVSSCGLISKPVNATYFYL